MRLYKRGAMYWFELEFAGKRYQKSTKSKNERVARQVMSAFHIALIRGDVGIIERKPVPTFAAAMKAFISWSTVEHQAHPSTTDRYRYSSIPLLAHFRDKPLDTITPDAVDEYKQMRSRARRKAKKKEHQTQLRPATVNRELACLRAMFNHAIKANHELRNPISKLTGVKLLAENNQQDRVLTYTEEERYLANAAEPLSDVATLILEQGARPGEVFAIEAPAIDLDARTWRISRGKTPSARRLLQLTNVSVAILRRLIEKHPSGPLFPRDGDASLPIRSLQSAHERAVAASKVPDFRLYDLRHTFATRAAEAGVDLVTLAAVLGHSRIQMVLRYAHPTQGHQALAMEKAVEHKATEREKEKQRLKQIEERKKQSGLYVLPKQA